MIIQDQHRASWNIRKIITGLVLLVFGGFLIWGVYYFFSNKNESDLRINTSFENKRGEAFYDNGYTFSGNGFQTDALAKTGKYSILVDSDSVRTTSHLEFPNQGRSYGHVSVWVKINKGEPVPHINVNGKEKKLFFRSSSFEPKEGEDWSLLELTFVTPSIEDVKTLVLDLEVKGKGEIYFDDLEIKFSNKLSQTSVGEFKPEKLNLRIDDDAFRKIQKKRNDALDLGVLLAADDDWVNAKLIDIEEDKTLSAKIRLKGDWTDHLAGDKWSYRVKFKKDHTWKRMKTLSFQSPAARSYLSEWVLHQLWEQEDILTTRYDFVSLEVNGVPRGIYAYEEHFEKQLLEYKSRREGPIVRFHEGAIWETRSRAMKEFKFVPDGLAFENYQLRQSEIKPFGEGKTMKSPVLARHFEEAKNLMFQYQNKLKDAEEIFDLNQTAKYYALCDLMGSHHATVWHNQRFYYNPVINKLEPIGYDGNIGVMNLYLDFRGQRYFHEPEENVYMHVFGNLAKDTSFISKYMYYLNEYTQPEFVNGFINDITPQAKAREEFLKVEFNNESTFKPFDIKVKAKRIQTLIWPFDEHSLVAYTQNVGSDSKTLKIRNKSFVPMVVLGTGMTKDRIDDELEEPYLLWAKGLGDKVPQFKDLKVAKDAKYIFCKAVGLDRVVYSTISPAKMPVSSTSSQEIFNDIQLDTTGIYTVKGDRIVFNPEKQIIDKNIIIPTGYKVIFEQGTELDFIKGAAFMSKSPVEMYGVEENPIKITSSDKTAKGFIVLQAKEKSIVNHTVFSGFDTWKYKNWILTGAVTFYESDVDIKRMVVTDNQCEDALNIIRSDFKIDEMVISNTFGDGFDADFCRGDINNSKFLNTGNDGMDFSGSVINITGCIVDKSGDKGLSVGEESKVKVKDLTVKNSVLGAASKDLSVLKIDKIILENCQQGFAAYRKKPEYGGGTIDVIDYEANGVTLLHKIEKGSKLNLKNTLITE